MNKNTNKQFTKRNMKNLLIIIANINEINEIIFCLYKLATFKI